MKGKLERNSPLLLVGFALFVLLALPVTWTGARLPSPVETPSPQPSATAGMTAGPTASAPSPSPEIPAVTGVSFLLTTQNVPLPTPDPEPPQPWPYPDPDEGPSPELPPPPAVDGTAPAPAERSSTPAARCIAQSSPFFTSSIFATRTAGCGCASVRTQRSAIVPW